MKNLKKSEILSLAKDVILSEAKSVRDLTASIDENFLCALDMILNSSRVVLTGIGKSGIIAKKISSTLSSTGTSSFYLHPVEALHGDMGGITKGDIIVALSNSGQTEEINKFLALLKKKNFKVISITSNPNSRMSKFSDLVIDIRVKKEACPYNVVPTSSTTAMLALGDAIAISLMVMKGFDKNNFADLHPGGNLGRLLNIKISDIMRTGKDNPVVREDCSLEKAINIMTETKLGAVSVVDGTGKLSGFFTDGDLRRKIKFVNLSESIKKYMTKNPVFVYKDSMAWEAVKIIQEKQIDNIPVVDKSKKVVGIVDERDLLKAGLL